MTPTVRIVNLTPHEITIHGAQPCEPGGVSLAPTHIAVPASGIVARVKETRTGVDMVTAEDGTPDGIMLRVTIAEYGEVEGLPPPQRGVVFIVSAMTLAAMGAEPRPDVFAPGPARRDSEGRIVGCEGLSR